MYIKENGFSIPLLAEVKDSTDFGAFCLITAESNGHEYSIAVTYDEGDGHISDITAHDAADEGLLWKSIFVWPENDEERNIILSCVNSDPDAAQVCFFDDALFRDVETGEILLLSDIKKLWDYLDPMEQIEYNNSFPRWFDAVTGKNGSLMKI